MKTQSEDAITSASSIANPPVDTFTGVDYRKAALTGSLIIGVLLWSRNLLAVIGLLTLMFLWTLKTSYRGSLELRTGVGNPSSSMKMESSSQEAQKAPGVLLIPVDSQ